MNPQEYMRYLAIYLALLVDSFGITADEATKLQEEAYAMVVEGTQKGRVRYEKLPYWEEINTPDNIGRISEVAQAQDKEVAYQKALDEWTVGETARRQEATRQKALYEEEKYKGEEFLRGQEKPPTYKDYLPKRADELESESARRQLRENVEKGIIPEKEAYGKGSAWETWQHTQAGYADRERQFTERQNVEKTIQSIQQRGYDSPEEYYTAIMGAYQDAHDIVSSGTYQQELAQRKMTIANQLQEYKLTKAGQAGQAMAFDYKPWYEKFLETPEYKALAQEVYLTPTETGATFRNWALSQPEFEQARLKKETEGITNYPSLYPEYLKSGTGGFQNWATKTPERNVLYEQGRLALERPRARAVPRWANL